MGGHGARDDAWGDTLPAAGLVGELDTAYVLSPTAPTGGEPLPPATQAELERMFNLGSGDADPSKGEDLAAVPEVVEALRYDRLSLERVYLLGGPDAISEAAVEQLREVLLTDDLDAPACEPEQLTAAFTVFPTDGFAAVDLLHHGAQECTLGGRPEVTLLDGADQPLPTRQQPLAEPALETSTVVPLAGTDGPDAGEFTGGAVFRVVPATEDGCDEVVEAAGLRVRLAPSRTVTALSQEAGVTIRACRGEISVGFLRDSA